MPTLIERVRRGWNAFTNNKDPVMYRDYASTFRPDRLRLSRGNERSMVTAIYNRIALDVAQVDIRHVRVDENDQFIENMNSYFNTCLSLSANTDQTGKQLIQDIVMSMFDEGCIAVVPTDTEGNPNTTDSYDIIAMRTGSITQWYPNEVRVKLYNELTGRKEEIVLPKKNVAIIENPLYAIMNEPNSTLKRLIHKMVLLDAIDEQNSSGKLDLIIQLPYIIKSETRKKQAEERRKDIEMQLAGSKYGVAYTDGTEKITQLNRPVENQLLSQIEYLTTMLYSQLGLTTEVMNGTANEQAMLNYYSRTIEPILTVICDEFKRKFLTTTAITQGQSIAFYRDPFKLVPINNIADIANSLTRNAILTPNEVRGIIGFKPLDDEAANQVMNSNIAQPSGGQIMDGSVADAEAETKSTDELEAIFNQLIDDLESQIDDIAKGYEDEDDGDETDDEDEA